MIINKEDIQKIIEDVGTATNSENKFRYQLMQDECKELDKPFFVEVVSELTTIVNNKLQEHSKFIAFPWIEFAIPYYISETVLSKLCKPYIEKGDWYSVRVCRMSEFKKETINGKEQYYPRPVTKFIFTFSSEIDKLVRTFYGEELRNGKWQTIA